MIHSVEVAMPQTTKSSKKEDFNAADTGIL